MSESARQQGVNVAATDLARAHRRVGLRLAAIAAGMVGLAFASVPLYRIFCQTTGYNGTTQRASVAAGKVLERAVTIRFDANVSRALGWTFEPVQRTLEARIGETKLAFFRATNTTDKVLTGSAVFNVVPETVGIYFNKIACFCFTEQTLKPGETVDMPVSFFIDPAFAADADMTGVGEITLSYTFYPVAASSGRVAEKSGAKG